MAMQVTLVLPPWLASRSDREAFVRIGASVAADVEVLDFGGRASVAALAARVADLLDRAQRRLVLLPAGPEGEQAAALIASACNGSALGRCSRVEADGGAVVARRPVFGGRVELALRSEAAIVCAALRPEANATADVSRIRLRPLAIDEAAGFDTEPVPSAARFPRVDGADLVVSGGRGIGAPEGFDLLARIAGSLGAGLGGSLPAVDAGWIPVSHQVGISGKFVTPRVYFAVGISGTPQHLAGVAPTARVIALNDDRDAPIFARSDIGVHGDWHELLPLLAEELELLRGKA